MISTTTTHKSRFFYDLVYQHKQPSKNAAPCDTATFPAENAYVFVKPDISEKIIILEELENIGLNS